MENKKGIFAEYFEAILRTSYKTFNLFLGTMIYFTGNRGIWQNHSWVAFFNVEGSTRDKKDIAGNIGSFVPGNIISLLISLKIINIVSSLGVMVMTWALRFENFFINLITPFFTTLLNRIEILIFKKLLTPSYKSKILLSITNFLNSFNITINEDTITSKSLYRFISAFSGALYWIFDLTLQHIPDVFYPLEAVITDWYMYVGPAVSIYLGLINKNYILSFIGFLFIFLISLYDGITIGYVYILGGITKSIAAFLGLTFALKFHSLMHPFYKKITKIFIK